MESLKEFLTRKRDSINDLFESHYLLYVTKHKMDFYRNRHEYSSIEEFKNTLINNINTNLINLNCTDIHSKELYKYCDEYIRYIIKYKTEHNNLEFIEIVEHFNYDFYIFITNIRYVLNKLSHEIININIEIFIDNIKKNIDNLTNWELLPINPKYTDKITLLLEELKILKFRWSNILEKESKEIYNKSLYEDAINWRKYKHLIENDNQNNK